jgi:hypothetical protein
MKEATGKVVLYKAVDGSIAMDVRLQGETVWLTQKQMSELFDTERSVITKHLRNIFQSKELDEKSVSAKFAHTAEDRKTYLTAFYFAQPLSFRLMRFVCRKFKNPRSRQELPGKLESFICREAQL